MDRNEIELDSPSPRIESSSTVNRTTPNSPIPVSPLVTTNDETMNPTATLPLLLTVTFHEAKNLQYSNASVEYSFDPYVCLSLNNKMLLRTPTIFKCRNHPIWNCTNTCFLLHNRVLLKIDIFDENQNKLDKLLATTWLNLSEIKLNEPIEKTYTLTHPDNKNNTNGTVKLTLLLEKNGEPAIKIKEKKVKFIDVKLKIIDDLKIKLKSLQLEGPFVDTIIKSEFLPTLTSDEDTIPFLWHCKSMVTDILYDCYNLVNGGENRKVLQKYLYSNLYFHSGYEFTSSCIMDLNTLIPSPASPCKELCLVFQYDDDNINNTNRNSIHHTNRTSNHNINPTKSSINPYTILIFPNKYILWIWTRWLVILFKYWKGMLDKQDLPHWLIETNGVLFNSNLQLRVGDDVYKGKFYLSISKKYELIYEKYDKENKLIMTETFSIQAVAGLQISVDATFPSKYRMEVTSMTLDVPLELRKQNHDKSFTIALRSTVLNTILEKTDENDIFSGSNTDLNKSIEFDCGESSMFLDVDGNAFDEPEEPTDSNNTESAVTAATSTSGYGLSSKNNNNTEDPKENIQHMKKIAKSRDRTVTDALPYINSVRTLSNNKYELISQIKDATGIHIFVTTTEKGPLRKKMAAKFNIKQNSHTTKLIAHSYIPYSTIIKDKIAKEVINLSRSFDDQYKTEEFETSLDLEVVQNKSMCK